MYIIIVKIGVILERYRRLSGEQYRFKTVGVDMVGTASKWEPLFEGIVFKVLLMKY